MVAQRTSLAAGGLRLPTMKAAGRVVEDQTDKTQAENALQQNVGENTPLTGMKRWLAQYHEKRPGLSVLQAQVDEFMADYDARQEKARREKLAAAEEDGWTVVVGNKGRKKTTEAESGVRVGAVSTAAVTERVTKKSKKEAVADFYRFQKREARRNELLDLQQKFEDDKRRIAKMREARKFRPY